MDKENVEYYLAIKRNELLIHATTWMNPENIKKPDMKDHILCDFHV